MAALGARVVRTSVSDAARRRAELELRREEQISRTRAGGFAVRTLGASLLRFRHFATDYAQGGLMMAVVGFKLMEWWYGAAEEKVTGSFALPVPAPPPVPPPHRDGVPIAGLASGQCPLCLKSPCVRPAAPACSGYVFCHECLTKYVGARERCPVTLLPTRVEDVRKLFSE
jgi:peroxin-12